MFVRSPYETYFAIGDVSGKGISASLLMAQTLSAMQFVFATTTSPSDALVRLNSTLSERIVRGMFVTTIVGRIIPSAGRIELSSAGHCKPVMLRADGSAREIETDGSLPLGILPKGCLSARQDRSSTQAIGSFATPTGFRNQNSVDEAFFEQKIISSLAGRKFASPQSIVNHLIECERRHRGARRQSDDLTILAGGLA